MALEIQQIIEVDENIRTFYLNYDKIRSYTYSGHGNVLQIAAQQYELYEMPTTPEGELHDVFYNIRVLEQLCLETTPILSGNSIQILNSHV